VSHISKPLLLLINTLRCGGGWVRLFQYHYKQLVTIIRFLDTVGSWSWWCIYFDFDLSWSALTLYNNDYICLWACVVRDQRSFGWDCRPFSSWNVLIKYNKTRFLNVHNCVCFNPHTTLKCDYLGHLNYYCRYISMWTNGSRRENTV